MDVSEKIT